MSAVLTRSSTALVERAFDEAGFELHAAGRPGAWTVTGLPDDSPVMHALLHGRWLGCSMPLPQSDIHLFANALELNVQLPGGARLVTAHDGAVSVRADLCIENPDDALSERVKSAVESICEAARRYATRNDERQDVALAHDVTALAPVYEALAESGYETRLDESGCRATLYAADRPYRASLYLDPHGGCVARAELVAVEFHSLPIDEAVAFLLLRIADSVRMVSAQKFTLDGKTSFALTGRFDLVRAETDAAHLMNALSIAIGLCGEEVRALSESERLAILYLDTQGLGFNLLQEACSRQSQTVANY